MDGGVIIFLFLELIFGYIYARTDTDTDNIGYSTFIHQEHGRQ